METVNFQVIPIKDNHTVLDLGAGEGRHSIAAKYDYPNAQVFGVDLDFSDIKTAQEKSLQFLGSDNTAAFIQANGLCLPFKDASVDHIICSEVLEHIPQYQSMLDEITRILKPGGSLTITVPRAWPEKICWMLSDAYHQVDGGHVRIFNARALNNEISQRGFTPYHRHFAHGLHSPYWWLKCLFWREHNDVWLTRQYHKLLVWDLLKKPWITRKLEQLINPILGKSIALYYMKK